MATIARGVIIVSVVHGLSAGFRAVRAIALLMCREEKKDKIKLAEGLSNGRVPRCVTTASTASNPALRKSATS